MQKIPENDSWKIEALCKHDNNLFEIETFSNGQGREVYLDGKKTSQQSLGNYLKMVWFLPPMDRVWMDGSKDRRKFLDRMVFSIDTNHAKDCRQYDKLLRERNRLLKDKISDVIISDRLVKSPVLLVAEESGMDINMEKLMKMHNQKTPESKKVLEINAEHPMIVKISENLNNFDHKKVAQIILDQANILDGNILSNPTSYTENLTDLFIK